MSTEQTDSEMDQWNKKEYERTLAKHRAFADLENPIYRNMQTECQKCYVISNFTTDYITIQVGQVWSNSCTTEDCQGDIVVTSAKWDDLK